MTARRVNASARKTTLRSCAWTSLISHSQNGNGLVCGLSTRKNLMPASTQWHDDVAPRLPQLAPGRRVPVEVVDVLVALGRVLGVLERAVGALLEPLRVVLEPRVVGRGVEREVERDVHPVLARRGGERADVVHRAELGVDGVVAALLAADRVRRAGVVRAGGERVVAALARLDADRVDGREVEDVEAELGDRGDLLLDRLEPAPASAGTARTRRRRRRRRGRPRSPAACRAGVAPVRSEARSMAANRSGASADVGRPPASCSSASACSIALRSAPLARVAACSSSTTPSDSSPARSSCAAATLRWSSSRQVGEDVAPGLDRPLPAAHRRRPRTRPPSARR